MRTHFQGRLTLPVGSRDDIRGSFGAPVTLVEYGDYQCPYCGEAKPIVDEIQRRLGEDLCFVFRNFPLTEVQPHAEHAAEASAAQGKFWEMHDILYAHQDALSDRDLTAYGASLAIASTEIIQALTAQTYGERIHEDILSGVRSGVNGTPTFFINGKRHDGPFDFDSLLAAITAVAG